MKRYLLFAGAKYYPQGGWNDFKSAFDTELEAQRAANGMSKDWMQIVDTTTGAIVWEVESDTYKS